MLQGLIGLILALSLPLAGAPGALPTSVHGEQFLSGRLGGNAKLEGGCVWLDAVGNRAGGEPSRYLPLWPEGYHVRFDPVRLYDRHDRVVAQEGDVITVQGRTRDDVYTTCNLGMVYEVERILAVNGRPMPPG